MRKHRFYGVTLAMLLGAGVITAPTSTNQTSPKNSLTALSKRDPGPARVRGASVLRVRAERRRARPRDEAVPSLIVSLAVFQVPPPPPAPAPAPPPTPAPAPPPPPPAPATAAASQPSAGTWAELRSCESDDNYSDDTGNGYYGAYQFSLSTWEALGYSGLPSDASPGVQDQAAQELQARSGWGQWPACASELGLD
ncbi:MAG TPA: transglycosylase family protein [Acidimicrobiales bacterium]|nr:transglycosylase family protein [Acidimicrobiales bacterium]